MIQPIGARGIITPGLGFIHPYGGPFSGHATLGGKIVNYYKLDSSSGTTAIDSCGANNITIDYTSSWQTGKIGNCIRTTGKTANANALPMAGLQSRTSAFTHGFWIKISAGGDLIWGQYSNSTSNLNFFLGTKTSGTDLIWYCTDRPSGSWVQYDSTSKVSTDTWYFVLITMSTSSEVNIYVNNNLILTRTTSGSTTVNAALGLCGPATGRYHYCDEWSIFNSVLTSGERDDLYADGDGLTY
jgi:hypothetical protein